MITWRDYSLFGEFIRPLNMPPLDKYRVNERKLKMRVLLKKEKKFTFCDL